MGLVTGSRNIVQLLRVLENIMVSVRCPHNKKILVSSPKDEVVSVKRFSNVNPKYRDLMNPQNTTVLVRGTQQMSVMKMSLRASQVRYIPWKYSILRASQVRDPGNIQF